MSKISISYNFTHISRLHLEEDISNIWKIEIIKILILNDFTHCWACTIVSCWGFFKYLKWKIVEPKISKIHDNLKHWYACTIALSKDISNTCKWKIALKQKCCCSFINCLNFCCTRKNAVLVIKKWWIFKMVTLCFSDLF